MHKVIPNSTVQKQNSRNKVSNKYELLQVLLNIYDIKNLKERLLQIKI